MNLEIVHGQGGLRMMKFCKSWYPPHLSLRLAPSVTWRWLGLSNMAVHRWSCFKYQSLCWILFHFLSPILFISFLWLSDFFSMQFSCTVLSPLLYWKFSSEADNHPILVNSISFSEFTICVVSVTLILLTSQSSLKLFTLFSYSLFCPSFHLPTPPLAMSCQNTSQGPAFSWSLSGPFPTSPRLFFNFYCKM